MPSTIKSVVPVFGENYDIGWIGFSYESHDLLSVGIAFFTRWDSYGNVPVSHSFVVSGPDSCVEALATGVKQSNLRDRFADSHTAVFFRKPKGWNTYMGDQIKRSAEAHIGDKYGYTTIVADWFCGTVGGRFLGWVTRGWTDRLVCQLLDNKRAEVCSELCAIALRSVSSLRYLGCLNVAPSMVTPQKLFGDEQVFEPWKDR